MDKVERLEKAIQKLLRIAKISADFKTFSGLSKVLLEEFEEASEDD